MNRKLTSFNLLRKALGRDSKKRALDSYVRVLFCLTSPLSNAILPFSLHPHTHTHTHWESEYHSAASKYWCNTSYVLASATTIVVLFKISSFGLDWVPAVTFHWLWILGQRSSNFHPQVLPALVGCQHCSSFCSFYPPRQQVII